MFKRIKEKQSYYRMFCLMDRPFISGFVKDERGKIIYLLLRVSDSEKYPGKSFELKLTHLQYYLFLWQKIRKWRILKLIAGVIALVALYYGNDLIFYIGGAVSLFADLRYFTIKDALKRNWYIYLALYILGVLILGYEKGIFLGSIIANAVIIYFDPSFVMNPSLGLNIDQIKHTSKKEIK